MYVYVLIFISFVLYKMNKREIEDVEAISDKAKWCSWSKASHSALKAVEKDILSNLKQPYNGRYINIGPIVGKDDRIWTISLNEESRKMPLVLLHGLGSGVGLWVMNLDQLAADRPVHAIDILGFASSSRPTFSSDPKIVEMQMVTALEEWRRVMGLDRIILLGHSLGGFISMSYAMQYPNIIQHLILADAWGMSESPADIGSHYNLNMFARVVVSALKPLNPLWALRAAGPWGEGLVGRMRPDLVAKFSTVVPNAEDLISKYIHQCNAQKPTGESGFHVLMHYFAFAKNPLIRRLHRLDKGVPLTMLFGSKSWLDRSAGPLIQEMRNDSHVTVKIIQNSGHHVNLDQPLIFNRYVLDACEFEDKKMSEGNGNCSTAMPTVISVNPNDNNANAVAPTILTENSNTMIPVVAT